MARDREGVKASRELCYQDVEECVALEMDQDRGFTTDREEMRGTVQQVLLFSSSIQLPLHHTLHVNS